MCGERICKQQKRFWNQHPEKIVAQIMTSVFDRVGNRELRKDGKRRKYSIFHTVVAFVQDNATMSSIGYFENRVLYFVQNQRK